MSLDNMGKGLEFKLYTGADAEYQDRLKNPKREPHRCVPSLLCSSTGWLPMSAPPLLACMCVMPDQAMQTAVADFSKFLAFLQALQLSSYSDCRKRTQHVHA
jgi:hypothetical protein